MHRRFFSNIPNPTKTNDKISVVIPTFNEEENINELIIRLINTFTFHKITYELIFIDDHSTDQTVFKIDPYTFKYPIKYFAKVGVKGKAQSLIEGFKYAKYNLVAMIDADLQYPPEAIPRMIDEMKRGSGVIVANRIRNNTNILRTVTSKGFMYLFGKKLHNLDFDVQSGLKVFKREILERLTLSPTQWTFDLEFLIKSRYAGYIIGSVDIDFKEREHGSSKVNMLQTIYEIGSSAIKLKFAAPQIIPFSRLNKRQEGPGFHFLGNKYNPHSELEMKDIALLRLTLTQETIITIIILSIFLALLINWHTTLTLIIAFLTFIYFVDLIFNFYLIIRTFSKDSEIKISTLEINKKKIWPTYSILCPLYKEWEVLPQFIEGINKLKYPKSKLQVLLILEEDDTHTFEKALTFKLPKFFKIVIVPHSIPKTKPKACNYALTKATGEYCVIYDAEDIPSPDQLKKAVLAFNKSDTNIFCIQAKLNFYNPNQNLITKLFTSEYSLWFDLILTGLQSMGAPIPLGGTSNHFRTKGLKAIRGWDAFNVTEDCDLGIRLFKKGFKTAIIDSTTYEEANSSPINWFRQRTRWIKGYIQTFFVHNRNLYKAVSGYGGFKFLLFLVIVGGKISSVFINPLLWIITISYFLFRPIIGPYIEMFYPTPILYMGTFSLVIGNFIYFYSYMMGCCKREYYHLIKYSFLVPFYWLAMSIAAIKSAYELVTNPHYWSKTIHGFHLKKTTEDPSYAKTG